MGYPWHSDIPIPNLNTLGSFVFKLLCRQTDTETDRQTDAAKRLTRDSLSSA